MNYEGDVESLAKRQARTVDLVAELSACVAPPRTYMGCNEVLAVLARPGGRLLELGSLPLGDLGHRLVALRYFIANREAWLRHFAWEKALQRRGLDAREAIEALRDRVREAERRWAEETSDGTAGGSLGALADSIEAAAAEGAEDLGVLVRLHHAPGLAAAWRDRMREEAASWSDEQRRAADLVYLATYDLKTLPATTVTAGALRYVIVADKGEMGTRAVREAIALGATPVALFNETDDAKALPVRLAKEAGGFAVGLAGTFKETYGDPVKITARVKEAYAKRFGDDADEALARSALYPGYGPLAESTVAIQTFRRAGIVFIGPTQDAVELAGDKRTFRALAERADPTAVTPGIIIGATEATSIVNAILEGHRRGDFQLPGRVKAANGGGGRGQVVVRELAGIEAAVNTVLSQIDANGWDPGVMFEQNIPETTHLEVQIVRDRYGNARHFGMRDCTEQRSSQKIQEEAPPALLRDDPALQARCCRIALEIADAVGYVGACTVELMYKDGAVYLLEMNTRIQVEHPVSEQAHRIRRGTELEPLNLVQLQLAVASGKALDFSQEDIVATHVAREFRINAESWWGHLKDRRDGGRGLFVPNAGIFDAISIPDGEKLREGFDGRIEELDVRFDTGFGVGDTLLNKDPTFGKLIVSVKPAAGHEDERYELLRLASIEVLKQTQIEGRQLMPTGKVIPKSTFATNLSAHVQIMDTEMLRDHGLAKADGRHVNWVVAMLRETTPSD